MTFKPKIFQVTELLDSENKVLPEFMPDSVIAQITSLQASLDALKISLITNSGLVAFGNEIGILLQSNSGLVIGPEGLAVQLPSGSGLKTDSTGLSIDKTQILNKFAETIGDGTTTTFTITHNLNTQDIIIQVKDTETYSNVLVDTSAPTVNTATVTFAVAPASNSHRVVIIG